MSYPTGRASAPPWKFSQLFGGEFIWDPRTDEIVMRTGQRFARPPNILQEALRPASYEGLPFQYNGSPPGPGDNYLLGDRRPHAVSGPANHGGRPSASMVPVGPPGSAFPRNDPRYSLVNRPAQAEQTRPSGQRQPHTSPRTGNRPTPQGPNNAMGRLTMSPGAPGWAPSRQPAAPSGSIPSPNRHVLAVDPRGETQVLFQSPTPRQIALRELPLPSNSNNQRVRIGDQKVTGKLFPTFKVRRDAKYFFHVGRIFLILWSENAGASVATNATSPTHYVPGIVLNQLGERVFSKVRRFVIIRAGENYCHALPINTYGGQGVAKRGVVKSEHVIIHSTRTAPDVRRDEQPGRGERGIRPVPIRVQPDMPNSALDPMSRLNLAGVTMIQHNNKVQNFGKVCEESVINLRRQFENVWNNHPVPTPQLLPGPSAEDSGDDDDDGERDAGEDDDDENDEDAEGDNSGDDTA